MFVWFWEEKELGVARICVAHQRLVIQRFPEAVEQGASESV